MSETLTINAPAKINLALDVLSQRPDGYHEVDLVMQSLLLADQVSLTEAPEMELVCNDARVPTDGRNLAWQAAHVLQQTFGIKQNLAIKIDKKIPLAAGLAGGSADAAAVLLGLNQLWQLGLTGTELREIGVKIGADVPFCLMQGTARARGIGERLTKIASRLDCQVLLVTPALEVATAWAYQQLDLAAVLHHPDIDRVVAALEGGDRNHLVAAWGNLLEEVVLPQFPVITQVKQLFRSYGLTAALMSGSGPTIFALDPPEQAARAVVAGLPSGWFGCVTAFKNRTDN